jgi:hypothetical protein
MSVKKFRFVSPGVYINEIDKSQIPDAGRGIGPVVIGRAERGPAMRPITVSSFSEFVETFGYPVPGTESGDVWRNGNRTAPTYGAYAAQAWLRNASPLTYVRLLGHQHDDVDSSSTNGVAGWEAHNAWGLFVGKSIDEPLSVQPTTIKITVDDYLVVADQTINVTFEFNRDPDSFDNTMIEVDGGTLSNVEKFVVTPAGPGNVPPAVYDNKKYTATFTVSSELSVWTLANSSEVVASITVLDGAYASEEYQTKGASLEMQRDPQSDVFDSDIEKSVGSSTLTSDPEYMLTLASVIYTKGEETGEAQIGLVGKDLNNNTVNSAKNTFVKCQGTDGEVKIKIDKETFSVNFNPDSKKYIRNSLNTNPTLVNSEITQDTSKKKYFLGETYNTSIKETLSGLPSTTDGVAILMKLSNEKENHKFQAQSPRTGWIISQHIGSPDSHQVDLTTGQYVSGVERLFRFEGVNDGVWPIQNLKIEISDIKPAEGIYSKYGSFSVTIRDAKDSDQNRLPIERFTNLNLNPSSPDYLARRIGDMDSIWDYQEGRYKTVGQYPNNSTYIRAIMNEEFEAGSMDPGLIPFGFEGPPSPRNFKLSIDGGTKNFELSIGGEEDDTSDDLALRPVSVAASGISGAPSSALFHFIMPSQACRSDSKEGRLSSTRTASFGATSNYRDSNRFDESFSELLRPWNVDDQLNWDGRKEEERFVTRSALRTEKGVYHRVNDIDLFAEDSDIPTLSSCQEASGDTDGYGVVPNFTLDDLVWDVVTVANVRRHSNKHAVWLPGSRFAGTSISSMPALKELSDGYMLDLDGTGNPKPSNTFRNVISAGFNSFTVPFVHGNDGFDITEREPFRNTILSKEGADELNSYAFNSVKRAIQTVSDAEVVECNIMTMPGITNSGLTGQLLTVCEERGDALAIIDLPFDYVPNTEGKLTEESRLPDIKSAVSDLKDRNINSSYGCAYYPWVQIRDNTSDSLVWVPPSVPALGTMASSQSRTELWFAPAGFNRGGLSEGSAGLSVTQVRYKLSSRERDVLYEANINPIASFPSEGIVIFGQKTLQVTPSALDRINVRRLMIYLKKEISRVATTILFDQNVNVTWQRFTSQVNPFLASVRARFGISEFKVVLDETTTTPDLIDRNIVYAKIFLKPTRSIEFIALDFVIARTGASFDD